mmetsp:Transcript_113001/g.319670  ORF Transcript_113001/g.319670 Transcript_113001/m.319670 type:complete len:200 (+) Transcript_113001:853-1452(+)
MPREHDVHWFQIVVDATALVHGVDGLQQFRHVESRCFGPHPAEMRRQRATLKEFHEHVAKLCVVEGGVKLADPSAVHVKEGVALEKSRARKPCIRAPLTELLQRVGPLRPVVSNRLHEVDDTIAPAAQDAHRLEISRRPTVFRGPVFAVHERIHHLVPYLLLHVVREDLELPRPLLLPAQRLHVTIWQVALALELQVVQ